MSDPQERHVTVHLGWEVWLVATIWFVTLLGDLQSLREAITAGGCP